MSGEREGTGPSPLPSEHGDREPNQNTDLNGLDILSDRSDLARWFAASLQQNPNIFRGSDILTLEIFDPPTRAGILAAALTGLVGQDGKRAVREFLIIVPPGTNEMESVETARAEMLAAIAVLAEGELSSAQQDWFRQRLRVAAVPDRRISSVVGLIDQQRERTAVIVTEAASYRDEAVQPYVPPGAEAPRLNQDFWVPQLHALAVAATRAARERRLYVLFDANELSPTREHLSNMLMSIDNCGVLSGSRDEDPDVFLEQHVGQWDAWISEGRLGRALRDLEQLPASLASQKAYLRIQLMHRAGHFPQALEAIRQEMRPGHELSGSLRVKLARVAQDADASRLATELLTPAIDELNRLEELESALGITHDAGAAELEQRVADRSAALFADSPGLRIRKRRILREAGDYAGVSASLANEAGAEARADFYKRLAQHLSSAGVPNYHSLIATGRGDVELTEALRLECLRDALRRQLIFHAFEFALPMPKTASLLSLWEDLLLQALEQVFLLSGRDDRLVLPFDRVLTVITALVGSLAADPANQRLRVRLVKLVEPSVSGTTGLALMAAVAMKLASQPVQATKTVVPGTADLEWLEQRESFVKSAFDWLKREEPLVIGRTVLPKELVTESADDVLSAVTQFLSYGSLKTSEEANSLQFWLIFAASIAPHSSAPDYDLRLIRLLAERLAGAGYNQLARDLAEQALLNSSATPQRRRLGWFTMAEVYHRGGNLLEALVALACTFAADKKSDIEQIWQEMVALARVLRDCGLFSKARIAIANARDLIETLGLSERHRNRLDTLELQTRMREMSLEGEAAAEVERLLVDVVQNGKDVLRYRELPEPVAALLGQLLRTARSHGLAIPSDADDIFAQLSDRMDGNAGFLVKTVSSDAVSAKDLLDLLKMRDKARYSEDIGYDMQNIAMISRRVLADDKYIQNAIETSFALELLADHAVAMPGWDEAAEPAPAPDRIEEPAEIAGAISQDGLSIIQLGFDASGHVVRVAAVDGQLQLPLREPDEIFNLERFGRWSSEYPYAYGIDEDTANLFYTTTADLRLSALPDGPVIVVADASIQPFPPNLFYVDNEFAGRTRPIAAAPSLAWLRAARAKGPIGDGRLCAWISTVVSQSESQTLGMIAQRLEPAFTDHGFIVDNGPQLPAAFKGATMAVIAAHGSIHSEGRYFQLVSDEGTLKVTAADLAAALRNVDVVILFVCSGGRSDKHPAANTTIGLAKQILDRGCQAVIASPWPLDARVPSHWLPAFLEQWQNRQPLNEANFAANKVVDQRFAQDPARGLAMTIFGNASLRRLS